MSGATHRHPAAAKCAICACHTIPSSGQPWMKTVSGPSAGPASIQAVRWRAVFKVHAIAEDRRKRWTHHLCRRASSTEILCLRLDAEIPGRTARHQVGSQLVGASDYLRHSIKQLSCPECFSHEPVRRARLHNRLRKGHIG